MDQQRRDGLYLALFGCCVFLLLGPVSGLLVPIRTFDFKCLYFGARCLIEGHDPYQPAEVQRILHREGGEDSSDTEVTRIVKSRFNYLPSVFVVVVPFALLPYGIAQVLWLTGMALAFVAASMLIWFEAARDAPVLAGALVFLAMSLNELSFSMANAAVYAVPLCVIGTWCFLRERYLAAGVLCFAVSLMLKPHDSGLIWLYFILIGGKYRSRALWSSGLAVLLSIPVLIYLFSVAPHWPAELSANLQSYARQGDVNDPGPGGMTGQSTIMITSLQSALSLISNQPWFYNSATYIVCAIMLVPIYKYAAREGMPERAWSAIAPLSALTMLVVYHRSYDGRLLLLAIPACAWLRSRSRALGWTGFLLLAVATVVTAAVPWSVFCIMLSKGLIPPLFTTREFLLYLAKATVPVALLLVALFFLGAHLFKSKLSAPKREIAFSCDELPTEPRT